MNIQRFLNQFDPNKIAFTSDTHLGHAKILDIVPRPFSNVSDMDNEIIKNWANMVDDDWLTIHAGDVSFKSFTRYAHYIKGKILVVRGNHDGDLKESDQVTVITDLRARIGERRFHIYHYPILAWDSSHHGVIHLYGHVHGTFDYLPIRGMDIGVDSWGFKPLTYKQVLKAYRKKNLFGESHYRNTMTST